MYLYEEKYFDNFSEDNTTIIFDTNVIIDLYTYSPFTIKEIIEALRSNMNYFWLPYQVQYEYQRNFNRSKSDAINRYTNLNTETKQEINNIKEKLKAKYTKFTNSGNSEISELANTVISSLNSLIIESDKEINILDKKYKETIEEVLVNDVIEEFVYELSDLSDVRELTRNELIEIFEEGELRYKYSLSPGFTDIKKKDTIQTQSDLRLRKYGDLLIWKEILEYAQRTKKNIIFVENERKSDWWDKKKLDLKNIPINMVEEFIQVNPDSKYSVITFEEFLFHFGERISLPAKILNVISAMLSHENSVIEYLEDNIDAILDHYVLEQLDDSGSSLYNSLVYDLILDYSFFGGTIDDIGCVEPSLMNNSFDSYEYDRDNRIISFEFESSFCYDVEISEYVDRYVFHSGNVNVSIVYTGKISFSVNIHDTLKLVKNSFDYYDFSIDSASIEGIDIGDYSIDVDVDEDLFRER